MNDLQEIMTVEDVCEVLGISRNTCGKLLKEHKLKGFKIGSRVWKIPRQALIEYVLSESGLNR